MMSLDTKQQEGREREGGRKRRLVYWSPGHLPKLGVIAGRHGLMIDNQEDYLQLLGERIEQMIEREPKEDREQMLSDAKNLLRQAFGNLDLDEPRRWLIDNPALRERILNLGLRATRGRNLKPTGNQAYLQKLHDETSLLAWVSELTGNLDDHLS